MKVNEFIEKVNEHDGMKAIKTDEGIAVGIPPKLSQSSHGITIYCIPKDATNFVEIDTFSTANVLYWKKPEREYLSALIEEFIHTPIKDRYVEKRYHLRWIDDSDGAANYLLNFDGAWDVVFGPLKGVFTESQLEELKRENPKLAPAIDAMKEEVEEQS